MADRRSLVEGLKPPAPVATASVEKDFVYGANGKPTFDTVNQSSSAISPLTTPQVTRAPISTRIRSDFAQALKRASLERQLSSTEPNTLQDILEEAIEPWLKANGYLP